MHEMSILRLSQRQILYGVEGGRRCEPWISPVLLHTYSSIDYTHGPDHLLGGRATQTGERAFDALFGDAPSYSAEHVWAIRTTYPCSVGWQRFAASISTHSCTILL